MAFGDSFTFGDDVLDNQTWPAALENILQQPVLNAGVNAYGIDQACMRAEKLLAKYQPAVIIVAFISDDIHRAEYSYFSRKWKPYYEYGPNGLELKNVPVPTGFATPRRLPTLNRILCHSYLAQAIFKRTRFWDWYNGPNLVQVHDKGVEVATELLGRLNSVAQQKGTRLIVMPLATDGRMGNNEKIAPVLERLRANHIEVFDLASEFLQIPPNQFQGMFGPKAHYGPELNRRVGERVAAYLGSSPSSENR